mgnify:CR=1 FL=1
MVFAEYLPDIECYLPIAEKLGVPMIATVTMHGLKWADEAIGLHRNPAVIPGDFDSSSETSNVEMSFIQRLNNVYNDLFLSYHHYIFARRKVDNFKRKLFSEELLDKKHVSLIFYNNHYSMLPRNFVPNAIEIGGIHLTPAQPLPKVSKMNYINNVTSFEYNVDI